MSEQERVERPAQAYYAATSLLAQMGLSVEYFTTPPPAEGVRVVVVGRSDGIATQWDMTLSWAAWFVPEIQRRKDVKRVRTTNYDSGMDCP